MPQLAYPLKVIHVLDFLRDHLCYHIASMNLKVK